MSQPPSQLEQLFSAQSTNNIFAQKGLGTGVAPSGPTLSPVPLNPPSQPQPLPPLPNQALFSNTAQNIFTKPPGQSNESGNQQKPVNTNVGFASPNNAFVAAQATFQTQPQPSAGSATNQTTNIFANRGLTNQPAQPPQVSQTHPTERLNANVFTNQSQVPSPAPPPPAVPKEQSAANMFSQPTANVFSHSPAPPQPTQNQTVPQNNPVNPQPQSQPQPQTQTQQQVQISSRPEPERPITVIPKPPAPSSANLFTNASNVPAPSPISAPAQTSMAQAFPQNIQISELSNYFSTQPLIQAVSSGSSHALSPTDLQKILANIKFYKKNDLRQRYYLNRVDTEPNFLSSFFKMPQGSCKLQCTILKQIIKYVSECLCTDQLMAFYLVATQIPSSPLASLLLDKQIELRNLIFEYGQRIVLNDSTTEVAVLMIGVVARWITERRSIIKAVEIALNENAIGNRLLAAGLKAELWESYKTLNTNTYRLSGETAHRLANELSQSVIKEEFLISKLLYKAAIHYERLSKKDLPIKEIILLFDEQRLQGSSLKLGLTQGTTELITIQQHFLLEIIPIRPAVEKLQGENANTAWNADLYNCILNTVSDPMLPFREILPNIKTLYNLNAVALPSQNPIRKLEATVHGSSWDNWLQLWLYKRAVEDTDEVWFVLDLEKKVFKDKAEELWNGHGYPNLRVFWVDLFKRRNIPEAFELSTAMLGTSDNSYVEPTLESISKISSNIIHREIYLPLKQTLKEKSRYTIMSHNREKGAYFQSPIRFLCKCVEAGPHCLELIEQMLLGETLQEGSSSGCFLILFLLDCVAHFSVVSNLRITKYLINAITALITNKETLKRVAVCIACFNFELNSLSELITKLRAKSHQQIKDQVKLTKALLNNLIAILEVEYFDRYFITSDCSVVRMDGQIKTDIQRLSDRFNGKFDTRAISRLCRAQIPSSKWLLQLLEALSLPPTSRTLYATNLLLQRLAPKHRQISESQFRLLQRFIDISNQTFIQKFIITSLNVRNTTATDSLFGCENKLWADSDRSLPKNRTEVARCLSGCLFTISTALTLIGNKVDSSPSVRSLIQQLDLVTFFERSLANQSKVYEYNNEEKIEDGWRCVKINLPTAIASLLAFSYDGEVVEHTVPQILYFSKQSDINEELKDIITSIDFKIVHNRLKQPHYRYFAGYLNVPISALRLLTDLMIFWDTLPRVIKPNLFACLGQKSSGFTMDPGRCPETVQAMMKCLLRKLLQQVQQKPSNNQQIVTILDFLGTCLQFDTRLFQVIFYYTVMTDSLSRLLQQFLNKVLSKKWTKCNIMIIHKSLFLLSLLLKRSQTSDLYKAQCISLLFKACYLPLKILQSAPPAQHYTPETAISAFPISNVLKERNIIWHTQYYGCLMMACDIVTWTIINNFTQIGTYLREICMMLFSAKYAEEMFYFDRASAKIQTEISRYYRPYVPFEDLEEADKTKVRLILNIETSKYGYGRNFNSDSLEFYDLLYKDALELNQIGEKLDTLHRWNCLRSCEEAKEQSIEAWACLFEILGGTGKQGFSFSGKLNNFLVGGKPHNYSLKQVRQHYGNRFMLINSEQFILNQGFVSMVSYQMGFDMLTKFTYELLKIYFKREETEDDRDFENFIVRKTEILNSALWSIMKVKEDSADAVYLKQIWQNLNPILHELMDKYKDLFERLQIATFFKISTLICAKLRIQQPRMCQFAIAYPNCLMKTVLLAGVTPMLNLSVMPPDSIQGLTEWTIYSILKPQLNILDFTVGMNILIHLCVNSGAPILLSCQFFDKLRKSELFIHIRDMSNPLHRHAYLWVLRLFVVSLTYNGDQRLQSEINDTLQSMEEVVLNSLTVRSGIENRHEKWKVTSAQLNESNYLMQILQLIKSDGRWLQRVIPQVVEGAGYAWMGALAGFIPNNIEKKLLDVKILQENSNRAALNFKDIYNMESFQPQGVDMRTDLFTFACEVDLLEALQSFLQLLCQSTPNLLSPHAIWPHLQHSLSSIQRYLLEHLTVILSSVQQRTLLLNCYNAFIDSVEQTSNSSFTYQFKSLITIEGYVGKVGAVLYTYFETALKLVSCVEMANQIKDSEVELRHYKKQLESAIVKTADKMKFREKEVIQELGLDCPPERLWAQIRNEIRSKL